MIDEIEDAAEFFSKGMSTCRDLRTFNLMEDELRKTKPDRDEDQGELKW